MRLCNNTAIHIKQGDTLYNLLGDKLTVKDYNFQFADGTVKHIEFGCLDSNNLYSKYSYDELYDNLEDLCDEEKSFMEWLNNYLSSNSLIEIKDLKILRDCYLSAFASGYSYKLKYSTKEMLQK